ncbi:hypothetical protein NLI96_g7404 [Meripilus lineatus]|uniref:Uncharacterized protein n=1 Tax=Meripilus lineatus TaxID=2056292 RepID=A0AAD5YC39_9APHY|nr:hypothetical protein NLI96_g7404 [Physisporinus lineatus]
MAAERNKFGRKPAQTIDPSFGLGPIAPMAPSELSPNSHPLLEEGGTIEQVNGEIERREQGGWRREKVTLSRERIQPRPRHQGLPRALIPINPLIVVQEQTLTEQQSSSPAHITKLANAIMRKQTTIFHEKCGVTEEICAITPPTNKLAILLGRSTLSRTNPNTEILDNGNGLAPWDLSWLWKTYDFGRYE